jgi:oligosaccharide repeat unit polymerase
VTWLIVPILAAFSAYFFLIIRRLGLFTADSLFVYIQLLMALGSLPLLDTNRQADVTYGYILTYTLMSFMSVSAAVHLLRIRRPKRPHPNGVITFRPRFYTWFLILTSLVIVVLYYQAVGYSALLRGLRNSSAGGSSDIAGLRLNSYGGETYLFPGYVNQFKNVLLPALVVVVTTYWVRLNKPRLVGILLLSAFTVFGLLGTGQRGPFIIFLAVLTIYAHLLTGRFSFRRTTLLVLLALPIVVVSTVALGRSSQFLAADADLRGRSLAASKELIRRVAVDNQEAAVVGFRYIYSRDIEIGREWRQSFVGLLPGSRGSDLSNRIFAELYGSTRGTAPPSIWGSIYHNFGLLGILFAPGILAIVYGSVTYYGTRPRRRNTMELIGVAGMFATMGFWAAGDPMYLLNSGLLVYVLLCRLGRGKPHRRRNTAPRVARRFAEVACREAPNRSGGWTTVAAGRRLQREER